ncbi:glutathione S-transferase T2-like [Actinidia eriantha]|uniref:glutathione S-transferase T2-like n=1 Tax=Actinidia eriantha TaxID=165200 RepID=UPI0025884D70|nr:glutathione S-transferase T2-like [Actinidia eriantha]
MTQRGPGFKSLEDVILCNTYILHSTDGEIVTYQKKKDLWAKIESSYNNEAVDARRLDRRNVKPLYARWKKISSACTLFRACITQSESHYESESSEVNTIKDAKDLYVIKDPKHHTFRFDHAWDILKYHEKWNEPLTESSHANDHSPLEGNTLNSQDSDEVEVIRPHGLRSGSEGRPTGRNAAKTRRRIANEKDPIWQEMMNSFAKSQDMMEKQHADNLAINQSKESRANILVELEQRKLEHKKKS